MAKIQSKDINNLLHEFYLLRKKTNNSFSIRAFAKKIGISYGYLSDLFHCKKKITKKLLERIIKSEALRADEKDKLIRAFESIESSRNPYSQSATVLTESQLRFIQDWEYTALLTAFDLKNPPLEIEELALKFNIGLKKTEECVRRLVELDLLKKTDKGLTPNVLTTATTFDVPSQALRNYHKQILNLAIDKIDKVKTTDRDFKSMTFAIDRSKIEKAKELTKNYLKKMSELLESGDQTDVYALNVQLFPLSQLDSDPLAKKII